MSRVLSLGAVLLAFAGSCHSDPELDPKGVWLNFQDALRHGDKNLALSLVDIRSDQQRRVVESMATVANGFVRIALAGTKRWPGDSDFTQSLAKFGSEATTREFDGAQVAVFPDTAVLTLEGEDIPIPFTRVNGRWRVAGDHFIGRRNDQEISTLVEQNVALGTAVAKIAQGIDSGRFRSSDEAHQKFNEVLKALGSGKKIDPTSGEPVDDCSANAMKKFVAEALPGIEPKDIASAVAAWFAECEEQVPFFKRVVNLKPKDVGSPSGPEVRTMIEEAAPDEWNRVCPAGLRALDSLSDADEGKALTDLYDKCEFEKLAFLSKAEFAGPQYGSTEPFVLGRVLGPLLYSRFVELGYDRATVRTMTATLGLDSATVTRISGKAAPPGRPARPQRDAGQPGPATLHGAGQVETSEVIAGEPTVMGSLDKELIRKVVHANRQQIRYCYEMQLNRFPNLAGNVTVKFVVSESGSVTNSTLARSTLDNAELETCVADRVKTWQFPMPKGGGVVIVTYPFSFRAPAVKK